MSDIIFNTSVRRILRLSVSYINRKERQVWKILSNIIEMQASRKTLSTSASWTLNDDHVGSFFTKRSFEWTHIRQTTSLDIGKGIDFNINYLPYWILASCIH